MIKNRLKTISLLILCVFFVGQHSQDSRLSEVSLYCLEREQAVDPHLLEGPGTVLRKELQRCLIVSAPFAMAAEWERSGLRFSILDEHPAGKSFYLVQIKDFQSQMDQIQVMQLIPVEKSIFLFSGDPKQLAIVLSVPFSIAALPESIHPPRGEEKALPARKVAAPREAVHIDEIPAMVQDVSRANLMSTIQTLQDFRTRYTFTDSCQAAGDYIYNYFSQKGIETRAEPFTIYGSYPARNIIATASGKTYSQYIVILCAHYDSISKSPYTLAPGADDNASGTAAVMEVARIISQYPFDFTVRFALFAAEEQGLFGSADYAKKAAKTGEKVIAVINLDMVAYTDALPEDLDIIANPASEWLTDRFITATQKYATMPLKKIVDSSFIWSDHSSFWDQGYSALCGIEDADPPNPNYHTTHDTLDTLNLDFAEAVTKAALATAAEIAQPASASNPRPPASLNAHSQVMNSLFSSTKTVYLDWQPSPDQVQGYNVYRSVSIAQGFQKINASLITVLKYTDRFLLPQTAYYYTVTAVDAKGRESSFSQMVKNNADNR